LERCSFDFAAASGEVGFVRTWIDFVVHIVGSFVSRRRSFHSATLTADSIAVDFAEAAVSENCFAVDIAFSGHDSDYSLKAVRKMESFEACPTSLDQSFCCTNTFFHRRSGTEPILRLT